MLLGQRVSCGLWVAFPVGRQRRTSLQTTGTSDSAGGCRLLPEVLVFCMKGEAVIEFLVGGLQV